MKTAVFVLGLAALTGSGIFLMVEKQNHQNAHVEQPPMYLSLGEANKGYYPAAAVLMSREQAAIRAVNCNKAIAGGHECNIAALKDGKIKNYEAFCHRDLDGDHCGLE